MIIALISIVITKRYFPPIVITVIIRDTAIFYNNKNHTVANLEGKKGGCSLEIENKDDIIDFIALK